MTGVQTCALPILLDCRPSEIGWHLGKAEIKIKPGRCQHPRILESATDKIYALELMTYMTEKEQEVVKLKAYGYTYREIATQCGLSIKAVGSRFARMRRRLKQIEAV